MEKGKGRRLLSSVAAFTAVSDFVFDRNRWHLHDPDWPPHARSVEEAGENEGEQADERRGGVSGRGRTDAKGTRRQGRVPWCRVRVLAIA